MKLTESDRYANDVQHKIHYLWRPILPDPKDDMVLEVAVAGQCNFIVTYNEKTFVAPSNLVSK